MTRPENDGSGMYVEVPPGFEVFKFEGSIYPDYRGRIDHPDGPGIGFTYAGEPFEGNFTHKTIRAFEEELGSALKEIRGNIPGIGHLAGRTRDGQDGAQLLWGVSLDINSKIYRAELTRDDWFPTVNWRP